MFDKKQFDIEMDKARREQTAQLAERMADYINLNADIRSLPISRETDREAMERLAAMPIPAAGRDAREVADEMVRDVYRNALLCQHPKFFSFVASAVSPYSLAGSLLTDIYNPHGGGWDEAPAACLIEEKIIKWMGGLAGYPEETCGGVFVSGGSMANMSAMIAARTAKLAEEDYPRGVAYLSDQTHSSVSKDLRMIGFRRDQIVIIPTDDEFKMRTDLLEEAIRRDIAEGKKPFAVIGTIGTTNTGSIDPLEELGAISERYGLWFHVDGAYGASILISDIYRIYAKGVELSDSLSWDTHKWMLQTYSCSSLIVKNVDHLVSAFAEEPEYLADIRSKEHHDPWDLGPEMSRPHRALKLWFTLQATGTDRLADIVDYSFFNANTACQHLKEKGNWEITSPPMCGALTFRYVKDGYTPEQLDRLASAISERINSDGFAYIVTSTVKGKRVLRLCLINGNTTTEDVVSTIDYLDKIARELTGKQ